MSSPEDNVPKKFRWDGVTRLDSIASSEVLLRRIDPDHVIDDRVEPSGIAFDKGWPKLSFNLAKYSDFNHILSGFRSHGVAAIKYGEIPLGVRPDEGSSCYLSAAHSPLPLNFSHAEIVSMTDTCRIQPAPEGSDDRPSPPVKINKPGRKALSTIKILIARTSKIVHPPKKD